MQPDAQALLDAYLATLPIEHAHRDAFCSAWSFDDNPDDANKLGAIVIAGIKQATASLEQEYQPYTAERLPKAGDLSVILDGAGTPLCIIETTSIDIVPFGQVDAQFARDEGEGDGSLDYWREVHTRYFGRVCARIGCTLDDRLPVVCERFRVVYRACPG